MSSPLANPAFRTLFAAQICSLLAVGLLTVALSLTAYDLGGDAAGGRILGFLLALKMVAYVGLAPIAETLLAHRPRRPVMVMLDLTRLLLLLPMALVTNTWQLAALAFTFFAVSSAFTPLFQSVIPDLIPDEETYTKALSYSRIAYTLEAILSPVIAAAVLRVVPSDFLFYCAAIAFAGSVAALLATRFPVSEMLARKGPFLRRALRGLTIYRHTPRLRGLFLLNFALSLAMAWVLVNTAVFCGQRLGDPEHFYPILMAFYGIGAASGALIVPRLVGRLHERAVMLIGAWGFAAIGLLVVIPAYLPLLAAIWTGFGLASSLVLTPGGLVLARSANREDRPAVFAAQFSLSHAGWLIAYPLAGLLASWISLEAAMVILCAMGAAVALFATRVWPAHDPLEQDHVHPELPDGHPHLEDSPSLGPNHKHRHAYRIDDLHPHWPGSPV